MLAGIPLYVSVPLALGIMLAALIFIGSRLGGNIMKDKRPNRRLPGE